MTWLSQDEGELSCVLRFAFGCEDFVFSCLSAVPFVLLVYVMTTVLDHVQLLNVALNRLALSPRACKHAGVVLIGSPISPLRQPLRTWKLPYPGFSRVLQRLATPKLDASIDGSSVNSMYLLALSTFA